MSARVIDRRVCVTVEIAARLASVDAWRVFRWIGDGRVRAAADEAGVIWVEAASLDAHNGAGDMVRSRLLIPTRRAA